MSSITDLVTAVFKPSRQLGPYSQPTAQGVALTPFSAQVTIEEVHVDELVITEHPVEYGASIADHAFKRPAELLLRLGWSNSGVQSLLHSLSSIGSVLAGDGGDFNYMRTLYNKLLVLQESRIPIDVTTGKRKYKNMLIRSLTVPTEDKTEHALVVTMVLKQVILVNTQVLTSTPADVQQTPEKNAPIIPQGSKQPLITAFMLNPDGSIGPQVGVHQ